MCLLPTVATAVFDYVASSLLSRDRGAGEGPEGHSVSWYIRVGWVINSFMAAAVAMHFAKLKLKGPTPALPRFRQLQLGAAGTLVLL